VDARDEGDWVVIVPTESVPNGHRRALRAGGESYPFAGQRNVDFPLAMMKLKTRYVVERLLVVSGSIRLQRRRSAIHGRRRKLDLQACERLSSGSVGWRYRITPVDTLDRP